MQTFIITTDLFLLFFIGSCVSVDTAFLFRITNEANSMIRYHLEKHEKICKCAKNIVPLYPNFH